MFSLIGLFAILKLSSIGVNLYNKSLKTSAILIKAKNKGTALSIVNTYKAAVATKIEKLQLDLNNVATGKNIALTKGQIAAKKAGIVVLKA